MNISTSKKLAMGVTGVALVVLLGAGSCDENTTDQQEAEFTERSQKHFTTEQPPHAYDISQARANLIAAHDAMALGADTWTVQWVEGVGVTFQCPSVGFPIPFGTNLTNPERVYSSSYGNLTLPLAEPYGLFPPSDVAATYANCVLPNGQIGIFYSEPLLTAYGFDVVCDQETQYCEIPSTSDATVVTTRVDPALVNVRDADVGGQEEE